MQSISNYFLHLISFLKKLTPLVKSALIASSILVIMLCFFLFNKHIINLDTQDGIAPFLKADTIMNLYTGKIQKPFHLSQNNFEILMLQKKIMELRKDHHLKLALILFKNYYNLRTEVFYFKKCPPVLSNDE